MKRVLLVPLAVLLELNALRIVLLILFRCIVAALTFRASERNQRSHLTNLLSERGCEPPAHSDTERQRLTPPKPSQTT